jgi:FkbM family methyltransferase
MASCAGTGELRGSWLQRLKRRLGSARVELVGPKFVGRFAELYPSATFVEIGAHDGAWSDQLRSSILNREWTGVMVEPVPYLFDRLRDNYESLDRVAVENAAISDTEGLQPFYRLEKVDDPRREGLPSWYDAIGSLSMENLLSHRDLIPDIEQRLVTTEVPCMTFESLCSKHGLGRIDLLMVDTEGHDWVVLKGIDLDVHRPVLLVYEHQHLDPSDRAECHAHLERHGYEIREEWWDTWCLHSSADEQLKRVWRRLRWQVRGVSSREPRKAMMDAWRPGSGGRPAA